MDNETGVLNIRGVDPELVRLVKVAAAERGVTMREWVVEAVELLIERESKRKNEVVKK
jgi:hypothetical protein